MALGGLYQYGPDNKYVIVVNGTGFGGAAVYGPEGYEQLFATEAEAKEYIDDKEDINGWQISK